jgi:hypothetical protein
MIYVSKDLYCCPLTSIERPRLTHQNVPISRRMQFMFKVFITAVCVCIRFPILASSDRWLALCHCLFLIVPYFPAVLSNVASQDPRGEYRKLTSQRGPAPSHENKWVGRKIWTMNILTPSKSNKKILSSLGACVALRNMFCSRWATVSVPLYGAHKYVPYICT